MAGVQISTLIEWPRAARRMIDGAPVTACEAEFGIISVDVIDASSLVGRRATSTSGSEQFTVPSIDFAAENPFVWRDIFFANRDARFGRPD
jgi:hypothetical protein